MPTFEFFVQGRAMVDADTLDEAREQVDESLSGVLIIIDEIEEVR